MKSCYVVYKAKKENRAFDRAIVAVLEFLGCKNIVDQFDGVSENKTLAFKVNSDKELDAKCAELERIIP